MNNKEILRLIAEYPLVQQLRDLKELAWFNPNITDIDESLQHISLNRACVKDASERLIRFAPNIRKAFPETASSNGIIESDIQDIALMKSAMEIHYRT